MGRTFNRPDYRTGVDDESQTSGGLTRGTGFKEIQRNRRLFSRCICSAVNLAMQEFIDTCFTTSEQHQEMQKRDEDDCEHLAEFFRSRDPFNKGKELLNIVSGVVASKGVNLEDAKTVGENILEKMESAKC